MKIKREIDGRVFEFELTSQEMANAYIEWQKVIDKRDVTDTIAEMFYRREITREEMEDLNDDLDDITFEYQEYCDEQYMRVDWMTPLEDIIRRYIG